MLWVDSTVHAVLANFGFPQLFRKINMFFTDTHLKKRLTPRSISLLEVNSARSHLFREYLRENMSLR